MTTSGTVTFNLDLGDIIEEAYARCASEVRSGWDFKTARISLNLMLMDWASRGINLWTVEGGTIPLVAGTATYNLPNDTVDLLEHVIRTGAGSASTQADLSITRISVSTYATIPNKLTQARPIQVYINRQSPTPTITVWPVPDNTTTYQFIYWRLRRIQDAGDGANTMDVPFRFIPCLVSGLAYYLAMKIPGAMERLPVLKAQYDQDWENAAAEDRERAAVRMVPRQQYIGGSY